MIRRLLLLTVLLALVGSGAIYWILGQPYSGFGKEAFVDIAPGTSTRRIAQVLHKSGVISSEWTFLLARALQPSEVLQAGEYRWDQPASVWQVFGKISRGEVYYYELRIPEGSNMFDIAGQLQKLGLISAASFLKAARNPALIRDLAPTAPTLEGYLFPSTYRLTRRTTAGQLCREMTNLFRETWKELGNAKESVNRIVTLASLVEKETAVPNERPQVASVYYNRLRLGMKLDCDPTTIYAALLRGVYRGVIHRSDLDSQHPYNTYQVPGLPPGPIANPGTASLRAALHPADTEYIYFVARGDGSGAHVFSESLSAHNAAVANYRKNVR